MGDSRPLAPGQAPVIEESLRMRLANPPVSLMPHSRLMATWPPESAPPAPHVALPPASPPLGGCEDRGS